MKKISLTALLMLVAVAFVAVQSAAEAQNAFANDVGKKCSISLSMDTYPSIMNGSERKSAGGKYYPGDGLNYIISYTRDSTCTSFKIWTTTYSNAVIGSAQKVTNQQDIANLTSTLSSSDRARDHYEMVVVEDNATSTKTFEWKKGSAQPIWKVWAEDEDSRKRFFDRVESRCTFAERDGKVQGCIYGHLEFDMDYRQPYYTITVEDENGNKTEKKIYSDPVRSGIQVNAEGYKTQCRHVPTPEGGHSHSCTKILVERERQRLFNMEKPELEITVERNPFRDLYGFIAMNQDETFYRNDMIGIGHEPQMVYKKGGNVQFVVESFSAIPNEITLSCVDEWACRPEHHHYRTNDEPEILVHGEGKRGYRTNEIGDYTFNYQMSAYNLGTFGPRDTDGWDKRTSYETDRSVHCNNLGAGEKNRLALMGKGCEGDQLVQCNDVSNGEITRLKLKGVKCVDRDAEVSAIKCDLLTAQQASRVESMGMSCREDRPITMQCHEADKEAMTRLQDEGGFCRGLDEDYVGNVVMCKDFIDRIKIRLTLNGMPCLEEDNYTIHCEDLNEQQIAVLEDENIKCSDKYDFEWGYVQCARLSQEEWDIMEAGGIPCTEDKPRTILCDDIDSATLASLAKDDIECLGFEAVECSSVSEESQHRLGMAEIYCRSDGSGSEAAIQCLKLDKEEIDMVRSEGLRCIDDIVDEKWCIEYTVAELMALKRMEGGCREEITWNQSRLLNSTSASIRVKVVPYDPVVSAFSHTIWNMAGIIPSDAETGITFTYNGSLADDVLYPDRRMRIDDIYGIAVAYNETGDSTNALVSDQVRVTPIDPIHIAPIGWEWAGFDSHEGMATSVTNRTMMETAGYGTMRFTTPLLSDAMLYLEKQFSTGIVNATGYYNPYTEYLGGVGRTWLDHTSYVYPDGRQSIPLNVTVYDSEGNVKPAYVNVTIVPLNPEHRTLQNYTTIKANEMQNDTRVAEIVGSYTQDAHTAISTTGQLSTYIPRMTHVYATEFISNSTLPADFRPNNATAEGTVTNYVRIIPSASNKTIDDQASMFSAGVLLFANITSQQLLNSTLGGTFLDGIELVPGTEQLIAMRDAFVNATGSKEGDMTLPFYLGMQSAISPANITIYVDGVQNTIEVGNDEYSTPIEIIVNMEKDNEAWFDNTADRKKLKIPAHFGTGTSIIRGTTEFPALCAGGCILSHVGHNEEIVVVNDWGGEARAVYNLTRPESPGAVGPAVPYFIIERDELVLTVIVVGTAVLLYWRIKSGTWPIIGKFI